MFRKEDEKWKQFNALTELMGNVGQKHVPDDFTAKVIRLLSEEKEAAQLFSFNRLFSTNLDFGFNHYVTKAECAFYFFITGFFYFILGVIIMIGLPLPLVMQNNEWLSVQPLFGLLLAAELTFIGIVLNKKGNSAIRFVRMGTVLYAALVILNFWISTLYVQFPIAVLFIAIFSLTGLGIAFLLGLAIDHYQPLNISSEVSG